MADHGAAAAGNAVRLDDAQGTRQGLGQSAHLPRGVWGSFARNGRTSRDLALYRCNLRLRFGNGRLEIFQRRFQLRRVELLGFGSELCMSVSSDLAFQLPDQCRQFGDEGVLLSTHSLFMLAGRTLHQHLELHDLKGLHHFGWKVWKLAATCGLRIYSQSG